MKLTSNTIAHFLWRKRYFTEPNSTPRFHYDMIEHFISSTTRITTVQAFRGSAKSTNICYLALDEATKGDINYILIISDTTTQAEALIADISTMVAESSLVTTINRDIAGEIEFSVNGTTTYIVGKGAGSSLRGIKRGRRRPDRIILDDIVNDELVMNKVRVERLNRWFYKALLPSLDPVNGKVYVVGTPLSQGDLFMHLCNLYEPFKIPLTQGIWKDRFTDTFIDDTKEEYKRAGKQREYLQEFELQLTSAETQLFEIEKIRTVDEFPPDLDYYATLDGAFSEADSADFSAFTILGVDKNDNWFVHSEAYQLSLDKIVDKMFELQAKYGFIDIGIEKGSYKLAIEPLMNKAQNDYQQWFNIEPLHTNGSKISRIKGLTTVVNKGRMTIVDNGEDAETLMEQISLTDNERCNAKHDDQIDSLCQCLQMDIATRIGGYYG